MTNNSEVFSLVPTDGIDPEFLAVVKRIAQQREVRDESYTSPNTASRMLESAPDRLLPLMTYYLLKEKVDEANAKAEINELWREVRQVTSQRLGVNNISSSSPKEINTALIKLYPNDSASRMYSHIMLLELVTQEYKDGQIRVDRVVDMACESARQLHSETASLLQTLREGSLTTQEIIGLLSPYFRWYFAVRNAFFSLNEDDRNEVEKGESDISLQSELTKQLIDISIERLTQWLVGTVNYDWGNGNEAKDLEISRVVDQQIGELIRVMTKTIDDAPRAVDTQETIDGLMRVVQLYTRATLRLHKSDEINDQQMTQKASEVINFAWNYTVLNSEKENDIKSIEATHSIFNFSTAFLAPFAKVGKWEGDIPSFYRDVAAAFDALNVYIFVSSANQMYMMPPEAVVKVKEVAFATTH